MNLLKRGLARYVALAFSQLHSHRKHVRWHGRNHAVCFLDAMTDTNHMRKKSQESMRSLLVLLFESSRQTTRAFVSWIHPSYLADTIDQGKPYRSALC